MLPCYLNTLQWICNFSWGIYVPVLPAVTRVTLLPKHSPVNLQFTWKYLCPCVTCSYPCYPVTQTQSSKFAIYVKEFVSLCYLRLPMLPVTQTQSSIFAIWGICVPVLPAVTRVTQIHIYLQFKLRYLCPCVTCGYPCYPNAVQLICI